MLSATSLALAELTCSYEAPPSLVDLPQPLQHCIFMELSVKERARACCVCRAWQQAVDGNGALWEVLDMGTDLTLAVLNGAVARAQGRLRSLTVPSDRLPWIVPGFYDDWLLLDGVLTVLRQSPLLRHLRLTARGSAFDTKYVVKRAHEHMARAGKQLETLVCSIHCSGVQAMQALLTKMTPYAALQLEGLQVIPHDGESVQLLEMLGANLGQQPSLLHLRLDGLRIPLHNSAPFFDALMTSRISSLSMLACNLGVSFAAGVAQLLQAGQLERLELSGFRIFTAELPAQLSRAMRHSRSLRELKLHERVDADRRWHLILQALISHPTLEALSLSCRFSDAAHASLLRVIAADSTALRMLHLVCLQEKKGSLPALAGALKLNRHLHDLQLSYQYANFPSLGASKKHLLPAVLACTSLRRLQLSGPGGATVTQVVADREVARLAAELAKEPGRSA